MPPPRLLVIDPDRTFSRSVAQVLARAGYDVRVGFDAASAQAEAARRSPDLILVDFHLPGPGGAELVRFMRKHRPRHPLAALYLVNTDRVSAALRECHDCLDDFILKPTHSLALVERIQILLARIDHMPDIVRTLGRFTAQIRDIEVPVRTEATVMFTDVRSFTQVSENRDPETVAAALNDLFAHLANAVLRFGGTIDKFMGDGMMAIFRTSRLNIDHELAAISAAQESIDATASSDVSSLLVGTDFRLGIGVHTGTVVIGPLGPPFAREVTAIGDTVNTAARLCGEARPKEIITSDSTYQKVRDRVRVLESREVFVKGKRSRLRIYSVELIS